METLPAQYDVSADLAEIRDRLTAVAVRLAPVADHPAASTMLQEIAHAVFYAEIGLRMEFYPFKVRCLSKAHRAMQAFLAASDEATLMISASPSDHLH